MPKQQVAAPVGVQPARRFTTMQRCSEQSVLLKALEPLGVAIVSEGPPTYGVELSPKGKASLCLYQTEEKPMKIGSSIWLARDNH